MILDGAHARYTLLFPWIQPIAPYSEKHRGATHFLLESYAIISLFYILMNMGSTHSLKLRRYPLTLVA